MKFSSIYKYMSYTKKHATPKSSSGDEHGVDECKQGIEQSLVLKEVCVILNYYNWANKIEIEGYNWERPTT